MKYRYQGVTKQKEQVSGTLEAADEIEARMRLRAMQVRPIELVKERAAMPWSGNDLSLLPAIDLKGLTVFTRQFSSLIDSGVPVSQCLDVLLDQERRPRFKGVLRAIREDIDAGAGLAESLAKHPRVFSEFFVRIVEAGEMSGTLDTALKRAGTQLEKLSRLRAKVIGALIYPLLTLVVAAAVLVFMLVKVIPAISQLYEDAKSPLPPMTISVLALSAWVQSHFLLMIVGTLIAVGTGFLLYRNKSFRELFDPIILRVPLFGTLILKASVARFARTMSTLIASGVPLLASFDICIKLMNNLAIKKALANAANAVSEGKSLSQGMAYGNVFPTMVLHMVNVGEMTGRLDELLNKVADIYDEEVDGAVQNLTGILQPLMIITVGAMIAFLLLAMYLPIFQLAEKVAGGT